MNVYIFKLTEHLKKVNLFGCIFYLNKVDYDYNDDLVILHGQTCKGRTYIFGQSPVIRRTNNIFYTVNTIK